MMQSDTNSRTVFDRSPRRGSMEHYGDSRKLLRQKRRSYLIFAIMVLAIIPAFSAPIASAGEARDASITLTVSPSSQSVNPGESGEYSIVVRNLGSNDITVQLQSNEAETQECGAYSSTVTQITGVIAPGATGEATMNVTLTQGASDQCDTTVRATANEQVTPPDQPGAPDQQESTVTTISDDGESSPLYGVDLIIDEPSQEWGGEALYVFDVEVENTGRVNETITLTIEDEGGPGCDISDLTVEVEPSTLNLDNETSEWVEVRIDVPSDSQASKYCWELHAQVQNDPTQNASDDQLLDLTIPEIHSCDVAISAATMSVNPDDSETTTVTFSNTGNTDYSIKTAKTGARSNWVEIENMGLHNLGHGGTGTNPLTFEITVSPDDSVQAGSEHIVNIEGHDGSSGPLLCEVQLRILVGQSHGATVSLSSTTISNVEPGGNGSVTVTASNQGNGPDSLKISTSAPPTGWGVSLSSSTVSVGSRHGTDRTESIELVVTAPFYALADDAIILSISVGATSGGQPYDTMNLTITVKPVHNWDVGNLDVGDQTGRSSQDVHFPILLINDGNVEDTFRFIVASQTAQPEWNTHFLFGETPVIEVDVAAFSEATVTLVVNIEGEEELDMSKLIVRIINKDDSYTGDDDEDGIPDNQREKEFKAILSNRNYSMDVTLANCDDRECMDGLEDYMIVDWSCLISNGCPVSLTVAPGGEFVIPLWINNTGDLGDNALINLVGLEGMGTRSAEILNPNTNVWEDLNSIGGTFGVPKAYGVWNLETHRFEIDSNSLTHLWDYSSRCDEACAENGANNWITANGDVNTHEARVFMVAINLHITISGGAANGEGSMFDVIATSSHNSALSSTTSFNVQVQSIRKIGFEIISEETQDVYYPNKAVFEANVSNLGNTPSEIRIFTSESLRGWIVTIETDDPAHICNPDDGLEVICDLQVGEYVLVRAVVKSPHGSEIPDDFDFTFSAEPTDIGLVGRKNAELHVQGEPSPDDFGLAILGSTTGLSIIAILALLIISYVYVEPRRRSWQAKKSAKPNYSNELTPLPVTKTGVKRFKISDVTMNLKKVGSETCISVRDSNLDNAVSFGMAGGLGYAVRNIGKSKQDIMVYADDTRAKPQLHLINRNFKKRIFDVMDSASNSPFCVIKEIRTSFFKRLFSWNRASWQILQIDGTPWISVTRTQKVRAFLRNYYPMHPLSKLDPLSKLLSPTEWAFMAVEGEDVYGTLSIAKPIGDLEMSLKAETFTNELDNRAMWVAMLILLNNNFRK